MQVTVSVGHGLRRIEKDTMEQVQNTQTDTSRRIARRVFFVYPPSVIEEKMIGFLVGAQIEAAVVKDHRRLMNLLRHFPHSIVYFNVDQHLPEPAWEQFIRSVLDSRESHRADIGILTYNENQELAQKYLMELGVSCGFITVKIGFEQSARILLKALEAAEARGDRRFIRVTTPPGKASLNVRVGNRTIEGEIEDISIAGMACYLGESFSVGTILPDVQLKLWGSVVSLSGTVYGQREKDGRTVHVMMFDQPMPAPIRGKLNTFVGKVLQWECESYQQLG